jgi:glycerol-3-phosphate acyltransferase PlsY
MPILYILFSCLIGYVTGAFPTGVIMVRVFFKKDIRQLGNRRPGAANIFREIHPAFGILVGFIDTFKGVAAALIILLLGFPEYCVISVCVSVLIGHNWSLFLGFKGGEGVGVTMGISVFFYPGILGIVWLVYLAFLGLWALRIKPFYLYHMYNWQSVFSLAPLLIYLAGEGWIPGYTGISFLTALLLSAAMALAGLLKQIELYGVSFLVRPADFDNKYARRFEKKA